VSARDQEFSVADVVRVSRDVAARTFPAFPHEGFLVILRPPCVVLDHELSGYVARVEGPAGAVTLNYDYWHVNPQNVIGVLCQQVDTTAVPLGGKVTFVPRGPRSLGVPAA
jgi:hypothetical protein